METKLTVVEGHLTSELTELDGGKQAVPTVPRIEFVTGRLHGLAPAQVAYAATGRNRTTGELTLGVSMRNRHNGMVRIEADLIRLPYDLNSDAIERLQNYWHESTLAKMQTRMRQHFGRTYICFDTLEGQTDDWCSFLSTVLADAGSYVGIGLSKTGARMAVFVAAKRQCKGYRR